MLDIIYHLSIIAFALMIAFGLILFITLLIGMMRIIMEDIKEMRHKNNE